MTNTTTPGDVIRGLREAKGLSQYALSRAAGLSPEGIRQIENNGGWRVSIESLVRICRALEVRPSELLDCLPPLDDAAPAEARGRGRPKKVVENDGPGLRPVS